MTVKMIKPGSIIDLKISVDFYRDLQNLLIGMNTSMKREDWGAILEKFQNDEDLTEDEYFIKTMLILVGAIESAAESQGLIEEVSL